MSDSTLIQSPEFQSFKSSVTRQRITVEGDAIWTVYDTGPRSVRSPLLMIAPLAATAECYYKQVLALSSKGIRVLAVEGPVSWTEGKWCSSFRHLLDHLNLDKVHLFGADLGGYLAQKFAELTFRSPMVKSLILCNTFSDTGDYAKNSVPSLFYFMPGFALKRHVLASFPGNANNRGVAESIDFMVQQLEQSGIHSLLVYADKAILQVEKLDRSTLASRLVICYTKNYIEPQRLRSLPITIIECFDNPSLSDLVQEDLHKCYPDARKAQLKTGGNFPYLASPNDVNVYLLIHLKDFLRSPYSPYAAGTEPLVE